MIDQAAIQIRGQASAQLADAVAQFLAAGGTIQEAPPGQYNPKPIAFIQPRIAPPPAVRRRREKQAQEREAAQADLVQPKKARELDPARQKRDAELAEMAKTMTADEACAATGINKRTLVAIGRRRGFTFVPGFGGNVIDATRDAKDVERVLAMKALGVTRTQCCRKMGISLTKLARLLEVGKIDYPTAGPGRPR